MKITIESTTKIVELNGIPCRIWEGETESGIKMHAFISRVAVDKNDNEEEVMRELLQCSVPSLVLIREIKQEAYLEGKRHGNAMHPVLIDLLNEQQEIISSPIRFSGVSIEKIKRVFEKYSVRQNIEF